MRCKILGFVLIVFVFSTSLYGQKSYWGSQESNRSADVFTELNEDSYQIHTLDFNTFKSELSKASLREASGRQNNLVMLFPNNNGKLEQFNVQEVSIFSKEIAKEFPNIKAYVGYGIDTPGARVRFSVSPQGLQSMISFPGKSKVFTVPTAKGKNTEYITYQNESRKEVQKQFECLTEDADLEIPESYRATRDANDQILRTFRIAISASGDYTQFWDDGIASNGDATQDAMAQIVSTLNRNNEVFEVDMAITFQLVSGANIIYTNPNSDPYTGFNSLLGQVQNVMTNTIGEANYDIGHLFHFGTNSSNLGNGAAACLGCMCVDGQKGSAFSSHTFVGENGTPYMSDYFDIDYVPHEIGHQMGANHTWSFASEGTGLNVEPGSGTTIMGYAGITGNNDVQNHSDPYFHYHSIRQILNAADVRTCWNSTTIVNLPPVAEAGSNFTIPQGTAFVLKGAAVDGNAGDILTYTWEQIDNGVSTFSNFGPTKTSGGLFRSRPPSTSPNRYMPILSRILDGELTETNPVKNDENTSWETVATVDRTFNFALTVRDRSEANGTGQFPQTSFDVTTITVDGDTGPFEVTSQTSNVLWEEGESRTITWNVAQTNTAPVNTSLVNILLSIDGGFTYPFTLATATSNDGSQTITVPDIGVNATTNARIMVEAEGNIFLAVNSSNFTIQEASASVDEEGFAGFKLFPNPSVGTFKLQFNIQSTNAVEVNVFDLAGRTIYNQNYSDVAGFFDEEISLGNISKGIYLLRVMNGEQVVTKKIVVE
jgi:hypothetical protein